MITNCTECGQQIKVVGDGSCAFRNHPIEGGKYFCCEACAREWTITNLTQNATVNRRSLV